MIDVATEHLLPLSAAAREMPGGAVSVSTVHRWTNSGIRGVRLETVLRGGVRMTSHQALVKFIQATTAAADGQPMASRTPAQRRREIDRAERELIAEGL